MTDKLKVELMADPLGRGYVSMSDVVATDDLNTVYRTSNRTSMSSSEILNAVDDTDWASLSAGKKRDFWDLMSIGSLNPFGVEATLLVDVFGGSSTTITDLKVLRKEPITRAQELGIRVVKVGHVEMARA